MAETLFSAQWYRVAELHPRLRGQVRVKRQRWRDQLWYLLTDQATGRHHRINAAAYQFIGRCDGKRSVQQVWDALLQHDGDNAPTQDDVIDLLGQLNESELLQCERSADFEAMFGRRQVRARTRRKSFINPFAFRLPLGDPAGWLNRLDPLARAVFRPAVFWLWLLGVTIAALAAAAEWQSLESYARLNLLTPRHLTLTWLCFPLVKALHEFGHALALRRWGGEVHEWGLGLLVLVPAPYVDASAATGFAGRGQRAIVGAAGIMVELALAALALVVWLNSQPGLVRDTAFAVMFIGSASTLLFNGNPLLRFDAYYVMCDLLDLPNLASRSNARWSALLRRVLLRDRAPAPLTAAGEAKWLLAYAPLSFAYRIAISLSIVLWLGSKWLILGLFALAYMVISVLLRPLLAWGRNALAAAAPGRELNRVRGGLAALALAAGLLLFVVPLPFTTVAPAVVWLPERAQVRPAVDGFIVDLPVSDGEHVEAGQLLAVLDNPDLLTARERILSRLEGQRADQYQLMLRDPVGAQNLAEDIARNEAELARAEERIAQLQVHANVAGRLSMPRQSDLIGVNARQGVALGYVLDHAELRVRAAVAEEDAFLVRNRTRAAEVRLTDAPDVALAASVTQDVPAATRQLPTAALGDRAGGPYVTDPADRDGQRSVDPVFLFDLTLPGSALERVGQRAWVRFDHGAESLAAQLYRRALQVFLKHFNPAD